ncbi:hypothetical protein L1987_37291 [Smallanthus sonchifolius]|uniref:Uncharacterized protein n=1 Tax=Smallanthus sonchifolius TaxID=185202 RepID=A0ACB9HH81_9ASTR|nr:hypothetical protein L1987_37291 [Smallanthus sonchifolius]
MLTVTYGSSTVTYGGQGRKMDRKPEPKGRENEKERKETEGRRRIEEKGEESNWFEEQKKEEEIFLEKIGAIDPSTKEMEATLEEMRG